jgi:hypothetical protein
MKRGRDDPSEDGRGSPVAADIACLSVEAAKTDTPAGLPPTPVPGEPIPSSVPPGLSWRQRRSYLANEEPAPEASFRKRESKLAYAKYMQKMGMGHDKWRSFM